MLLKEYWFRELHLGLKVTASFDRTESHVRVIDGQVRCITPDFKPYACPVVPRLPYIGAAGIHFGTERYRPHRKKAAGIHFVSIVNLSDWPADFASCGLCLCFVCAFDLPSYMTTGVYVDVILTASSHVRTEPQSVIGHTGEKKIRPACRVLRYCWCLLHWLLLKFSSPLLWLPSLMAAPCIH